MNIIPCGKDLTVGFVVSVQGVCPAACYVGVTVVNAEFVAEYGCAACSFVGSLVKRFGVPLENRDYQLLGSVLEYGGFHVKWDCRRSIFGIKAVTESAFFCRHYTDINGIRVSVGYLGI